MDISSTLQDVTGYSTDVIQMFLWVYHQIPEPYRWYIPIALLIMKITMDGLSIISPPYIEKKFVTPDSPWKVRFCSTTFYYCYNKILRGMALNLRWAKPFSHPTNKGVLNSVINVAWMVQSKSKDIDDQEKMKKELVSDTTNPLVLKTLEHEAPQAPIEIKTFESDGTPVFVDTTHQTHFPKIAKKGKRKFFKKPTDQSKSTKSSNKV